MKAKQSRYIDLSQFPQNNKGRILWKESVGTIAKFLFNEEWHELEILEYIRNGYLKIRVDGVIIDNAQTTKVTGLRFEDMFYKPNYLYEIGDIVNNLLVLEQTIIKKEASGRIGFIHIKAYRVKCLNDGYEYVKTEYDLMAGGCPVCANLIIIKGINDIATTDPDVVDFLVNKEDAYKYSRGSKSVVPVRCPYCGYEKQMSILNLCKYGHMFCDRCSDGVSYPNKFAHELFEQLKDQWLEYSYEYSPDWIKPYSLDNYIKLNNHTEIVVEMDGGFHYRESFIETHNNDIIKNKICKDRNIIMIRIDCDYRCRDSRFDYIKTNIIKNLSSYFDLSNVDWNKCNEVGLTNILIEVVDYYNQNPKCSIKDIGEHFGINTETARKYIIIGDESGLCNYIRNDQNRRPDRMAVSMVDVDGNLIGIFKSARVIEETFPGKDLKRGSIRQYAKEGKLYKGYMFTRVPYEQYLEYSNIVKY